MRLTLGLLLVLVAQGWATKSYSQKAILNLDMKNAGIIDVLEEIENQSDYYFLFNYEQVHSDKKMDVKLTNSKIEETLNFVLSGTGLKYTITDRQIVISKDGHEKTNSLSQQQKNISGKVTDSSGQPLPGVSIAIKGTATGMITNFDGKYTLSNVPDNATLVFSFVGMKSQEVVVGNKTTINITLIEDAINIEGVVVVGYGTQKKSDITGTVASLPQERLEMAPNISITQAMQGAIPGVQVTTSTAGAAPSQSIMIRGRNSIKASNSPLVVVDGVAGSLADVNPNDVESIEVLKDASAAAIYGSRGSNGVILVTTKSGKKDGETKVKYSGFYSMQRFINLPDLMDGEEFYNFKMERNPTAMTPSELAVYESGEWVDWLSLALRQGMSTEHNLSLSGGFKDTKYYISGSVTDVKGLAVNDDYLKLTSRINLDTKIGNWLTVGTRTQLAYTDAGGIAPTWDGDQGVFWFNPLTTAYDENGDLTIYPWPDDTYFRNPLQGTLARNIDESYQVVANNYAIVDFPFVKGLQYRINAGVRLGFSNDATYYGRDTQTGLANRGDASTSRGLSRSIVVENIANYNREFGKHSIFVTGVYSFENAKSSTNSLSAEGFPNDVLTWFGAPQAELIVPGFSYSETSLLSAMARINYSFDSRYLLTLTGRSDGYSGFGTNTKRGFFPSMAVGWNIANEKFFGWKNIFTQLKLRASLGVNGNQAVGAYETISRLSANNMVAGTTTLPGYVPNKLGQDNLGWESTRTLNAGIDFGILNNRVTGEVNLYKTNTSDLLLDRTISPVHAVTSITQNIGETENQGLEISFVSTNISSKNLKWETTGNISFVKNKIVSLYGYKDEHGKEIDDVANAWFIGKPIQVNYGFLWDGVWQLDEAEEAAAYLTQPGYIKIKDISGPDGVPDGVLSPDYDRIIIGQEDPKYIWGMNNSLSYKNLTLNVFIHGAHGVTKNNPLLSDAVDGAVRQKTTIKNWWRPDNPTNDWYMNATDAYRQAGYGASPYEKAGFVRIKDISLAYDFSKDILSRFGFGKFQVYVTGRNLFTFTKYGGLDPELSGQRGVPMQKEYVFGVNLEF
ncbi:MAG TPA: SusC/RagA family TonB-linked outer membrane protein [Prolixibacteraceae bacterium]|nr:SusC/RagA family TonB-linked outer membrane protein [Prolixibacteraceae bacterium]HCR89523.1 SusC/RagA family TonB-linked outer membrane protein [Prolixibacteraceae bacterium]HCU63707.1 SusC/RagA family TonB-linked outer membrane protein [Prolixibacteraceae bacterium]